MLLFCWAAVVSYSAPAGLAASLVLAVSIVVLTALARPKVVAVRAKLKTGHQMLQCLSLKVTTQSESSNTQI